MADPRGPENNLVTIACGMLLAVLILQFVQPVIVKGDSMYPNLKNGNYLVMCKTAYLNSDPEYGDIVVFPRNGELLIKRVEGKPGDEISFSGGNLYRNGKKVEEEYIEYPTYGDESITAGENEYVVLGDNRTNSMDSRFPEVGLVEKSEITGRAEIRLMPEPKML